MKAWLLLNLAVLAALYAIGGWDAVRALLLLEVIATVFLGAVFIHTIATRELESKRRILRRVEGLLAERDEMGDGGQRVVDPPWRGPR